MYENNRDSNYCDLYLHSDARRKIFAIEQMRRAMKRKADCDAKEEVEAHRMKIMRSTMALVRNDADDTKKQASLKAKKELLVSLTEEFNEQVLGEIHEKMSELPESIKKEVKEKVQSISLGPVEWFSDKLEGYLNEINAQIN